jgi:hypothetical protein
MKDLVRLFIVMEEAALTNGNLIFFPVMAEMCALNNGG